MIDPAVLRAMLNAGCTADQIVAVAEEAAQADEAKRAAKRAGNAERQRRHRERNALSRVTGVTNGDTPSPKKEIPPTPPKEKTTPSPLAPKGALGVRDFFAEFWLAYPRREGPNPKKPAKLAFDRLVAKGIDPERIIEAARQLAVEHPTPTRFVPQAVTWLNQERFADDEPVMKGDEFCPADWYPTRFLVSRFRRERQHDPPDAIHGGRAGFMLPAEWVAIAKQGQAENARLEN